MVVVDASVVVVAGGTQTGCGACVVDVVVLDVVEVVEAGAVDVVVDSCVVVVDGSDSRVVVVVEVS